MQRTMSVPRPLIIQSDRTILLEVDHPEYQEVRSFLGQFAELLKSPEHIHTYRISSLSLWNAASAGMSPEQVVEGLRRYSRYELPQNIVYEMSSIMGRYGLVQLVDEDGELFLRSGDELVMHEIRAYKPLRPHLSDTESLLSLRLSPYRRGIVKQELIRLGYPVEDLAGYIQGDPLELHLRTQTAHGAPLALRPYQQEAVDIFHADGKPSGGAGVIVLPCGAGKTLVGMGVMTRFQTHTLILSPNVTGLRQWREELLDKTTLSSEQIGEYSGDVKEIRPVTLTTYQMMTHRTDKTHTFPHLDLFTKHNWGLIIYDEVHLLPAPVFRVTADIQSRRRLGMTATLIREDGRESDVFSLVGPKRYDVPWKEIERSGFLAVATCHELRVALPQHERLQYAAATARSKIRIAAENRAKDEVVLALVEKHADEPVLVIGQYLRQLQRISKALGVPIITGETKNHDRERLYHQFRTGALRRLVVSKVANFAVDLPEASVAIQISGTFGSRQEEAQRLGRILRPKAGGGGATFYSVVTRDTRDEEFSENRQLFLTEQGYRYFIHHAEQFLDELAEPEPHERPRLKVILGGKP
jgi:DNA excision repair protein ERCC-3